VKLFLNGTIKVVHTVPWYLLLTELHFATFGCFTYIFVYYPQLLGWEAILYASYVKKSSSWI